MKTHVISSLLHNSLIFLPETASNHANYNTTKHISMKNYFIINKETEKKLLNTVSSSCSISRYIYLQNLKDQILTTNIWLEHVSTTKIVLLHFLILLDTFLIPSLTLLHANDTHTCFLHTYFIFFYALHVCYNLHNILHNKNEKHYEL